MYVHAYVMYVCAYIHDVCMYLCMYVCMYALSFQFNVNANCLDQIVCMYVRAHATVFNIRSLEYILSSHFMPCQTASMMRMV